jgi:serpin B
MHATSLLPYADLGDAHLVSLPYQGGAFSMQLLVPKAVDGAVSLTTSITAASLQAPRTATDVELSMPRFRISGELDVGKVLAALGARTAVTCDGTGHYDGIAPTLCVSAAIHKAFVDVTEKGTEAAAATAVSIKSDEPEPPPVVVRADRPFLFAISENTTGAIVFIGRVSDPTL